LGVRWRNFPKFEGSNLKTVLVTGAAGFLGSHLCDALIEREYRVFGLDNLSTGKTKNIDHLNQVSNFKFYERNLSFGLPNELQIEFDEIYHLASPASPPRYLAMPLETLWVNTKGTEFLLNHTKNYGGRLLFASTSEIYGDPFEHPQREAYWGNVNPIGPRSVYDEAKRLGETYLSLYHRENWANTVIIRIFNTYGPRLDPNDGRVISSFLRDGILGKPIEVFGDGTQTRSFCFVDDLIDGIIKAQESNQFGPINLGNPDEFSLLELADKISLVLNKKLEMEFKPLPEDDPKRRKPDISLAKDLLDWEPKINLLEGLEKTAEWMRKNL